MFVNYVPLKFLLPLLPKFADGSGYDVVVTFGEPDSLNTEDEMLNVFLKRGYQFKNSASVENASVSHIRGSKPLAGGERDNTLQLYISHTSIMCIRCGMHLHPFQRRQGVCDTCKKIFIKEDNYDY